MSTDAPQSAPVTLFFAPLDVLFFRDYRPADAGWNVLGQSMFPLPSVMLGCVRAALYRAQGANFRDRSDPYYGVSDKWAQALIGSRERAGTLKLAGPLLAKWQGQRVEPLFALPTDMVAGESTSDKSKLYRVARPVSLSDAASAVRAADGPYCYTRHSGDSGMRRTSGQIAWTSAAVGKSPQPLMLTERGMARYWETPADGPIELTKGRPEQTLAEIDVVAEDQLMKREDRFGIARTSTRTAESQMFYLKRPYRLAPDFGFAVEVELPTGDDSAAATAAIRALDGALVTLGGRGHRARVRVVDQALLRDAWRPQAAVHKAVYLTPAPLADGTSEWPAGVSGVAERLQAVGGFDQGRRQPRPLRQALPAGTVVYGHSDGSTIADITEQLCGFERDQRDEKRSQEHKNEAWRLDRAGFAWALGQPSKP